MKQLWVFLAVTLGACGSQAPHAPDNIADLMPYFWKNWDTAPTAQMAEAVVNLANAATVVTIGNPMKAELDPMQPDAIAGMGLSDRDTTKTAGLLIVNVFKCTLPQLEKLLIDTDQASLHTGVYDA
jgi:hypothetical protein